MFVDAANKGRTDLDGCVMINAPPRQTRLTSHAMRDEHHSGLIVHLVGVLHQLSEIVEELSLFVESLPEVVSNERMSSVCNRAREGA